MSTFFGFLCIAAVTFILFAAILAFACLMFGNRNEEDES